MLKIKADMVEKVEEKMKTNKIEISKELLKHLFALTIIQVDSVGENTYYTLYDNEHYSSINLTAEQGIEMLKLKEDIKE